MAKYKVRHALLPYQSKNALGQDTHEVAFRNMEVELEDGPETDRLLGLGAIVPNTQELARPGRMLGLPETATDEEILNWVAGATTTEVGELVQARPVMGDRLLAAQDAIRRRFEAQAELLGQALEEPVTTSPSLDVVGDNSGGVTPAPQPSTTETPAVNDPGEVSNPATSGQGGLVEGSGLSAEEADKVVAGGARQVAEYVSENPRHAKAILDAENRRDEDPRPSVVRAVTAAASFGAQ